MNQKQVKVGLFIVIGVIITAFSIFIMGSNKSFFQNTLTIHSYFDSAQGLNKGGVVSFAGVKVGNIDAIDYDEAKDLVKVSYIIEENLAAKIKADSVVEIRTQGALGDKYLYITPGRSGTKIADNSEIKSEYGNDFLSILSKRGRESEKIFDAITDLQKLIRSLNDHNKLPSLISKLDQTAGNLSEASVEIKKAVGQGRLDKTLTKVDRIVDKIDSGQGTLGALINDRSLHERLKNILGAGQKQQQIKSILKSSVEDE